MLLHKTNAEYIVWMKRQESILSQKARIKWAEEGDSNTKYFHSTIKERRRRSRILRIQDHNASWIEGNRAISQAAVDHFSDIFSQPQEANRLDILRWMDKIVTEEDNQSLHKEPTKVEIRNAIFSLDPNSAAGPDGYNGHFFQAAWDIIKEDVYSFVISNH
ncbi:hypothetical protein A4A49_11289 [Nicotiana attenuata]|uniref:Reverse transcriptase domain-containing protein n=1 Tax=Nicotiana attenuata TaxID=49451 RepID=A0A314KPK2_NICAT|nr:hypothetical protein A4A49_11289 [Nicotiana attenuata]